jgi:putative salt-induced outer membrane protein YdiY
MRRSVLAAAVLIVLAATDARADEVVLKNGDKITGKILDLGGGKLRIETGHSGVVTVDWGQVASLRTDGHVRVKLSGGEYVEGKVTWAGDKFMIETLTGPKEVKPDQVQKFNEPPVEWHGGFNIAGRTADGNTHTTSMLLNFDALRESENDRMSAKAVFRYEKTRDTLEERNGYGIGKYEYFISQRMYAVAAAEFLSDRFKDLRLRKTFSAGLGYIFLKEEKTDLWGDVGPAHIHNDFLDEPDESHYSIRFSAHFRQVLPLSLELVDDFWITPNLEEGDNWQARNDFALTAMLGAGWSCKTGVITDYDNDPPDDVRKRDNTYYVGLGYRF